MRSLIHARPAGAVRASSVVLAVFALASACVEQDQFPTSPRPTATRPLATIFGADITVLPTLGGLSTFAADINESGAVVGQSDVTLTGTRHAFLWTPAGGMQDLGTLGGAASDASGINEAGQVVGSSGTAASAVRHAFLWTPGVGMQDLGTLGGPFSVARSINDRGQVVGGSTTASGETRPFLWTPGQGMQNLGTLGGASADAIAINNAGQVTGTSTTLNGELHPFLWTSGQGMQDLGTLGGDPTVALALNELAWVVGRTNLGPEARAFLWVPRVGMRDLGNLGAANRFTSANDVNDAGLVVGSSFPAAAQQHAFLWTVANGMEDLYPLTGMTSVAAINNRGQVVGGDRVATLRLQSSSVFATGGGFYMVAGTEKAHFAFNVKFPSGQAAAPNGTVRFWIPGRQTHFESTALEMMVVVGNRAQFWGTGVLNGAPARFRITAVDGEGRGRANADAFRIELWVAGALVFDTQPGAPDATVTTEIDAGNIRIHSQ